VGAHGVDPGDLEGHVPIEQVLHQHHGVVALVHGLAVEVLGELREVGAIEVHGDGNILLRGRELAADLLFQQTVELGVECEDVRHENDDIPGQRALSAKVNLTQVSFT
jgi:hypothetical protein